MEELEKNTYLNEIPGALIKSVSVNDKSVVVETKNNGQEVFEESRIADLLNLVSSRVQIKIPNIDNQYKVDQNLEQVIYQHFLDVVWFYNGAYIYTGDDLRDKNVEQIIIKRRKSVLQHYLTAPKRLVLVNDNTAKDENGQEWSIGYSKLKIRISSDKINGSNEQVKLNQIICRAATTVNNSPNFKYPRKEDGAEAITGSFSKDFVHKDRFLFELRPGIKPSVAVKKLLEKVEKPYVIECKIAIEIIEYLSLLDFLGDDQFDKVFCEIGVVFSRAKRKNAIDRIRENLSEEGPERASDKHNFLSKDQNRFSSELVPGEMLYIRNVESYLKRHPFGECAGHNVIYIGKNSEGEPLFAGLFTEKKVRTYREIVEMLIDDYNETPHYIEERNGQVICNRSKFGGFC